MTNEQIEKTYEEIKTYYEKYLKSKGIKKMPGLKYRNQYTQNALVLIRLFQGYPNTKAVSKTELTSFVNSHRTKPTNDLQSARHLGKQQGWYIRTGTRDKDDDLNYGEYKLITLEDTLPGFIPERRNDLLTDDMWDEIKKQYGNRCVCCGSVEGQPHLINPTSKTELQKGHMDPSKPLTADNVIPQCSVCNRPDRDWWIYDKNGRVVAVADPHVITRSSIDVQKAMYEILKKKFD